MTEKLKTTKLTPPSKDRPEAGDILYSERNFESFPDIWALRTSSKPKKIQRKLKLPDGSRVHGTINIRPGEEGTLTIQDYRIFCALMRIRQDELEEIIASDEDRAIPISIRKIAKYLNPGKSQKQRWGGRQHKSIVQSLRRLAQAEIDWHASWWDAKSQSLRGAQKIFHILQEIHLTEEQKFDGSKVISQSEGGYVRFNSLIERNLDRNFTSPIYYSERIEIGAKSPFAMLLYDFLDRKFTGVPAGAPYKRDLTLLFEEDFPSHGPKNKRPAKQREFVERTFQYLKGRKITTGVIQSLALEERVNGKGFNLVVHREGFFAPALESNATEPLMEILSAESSLESSEDAQVAAAIQRSLADAKQSSVEESSDPACSPNLSAEQVAAIERIEGITTEKDEGMWTMIAQTVPIAVVHKLCSEIEQEGTPGFRGATSMAFVVRAGDWFREQDQPIPWRSFRTK